MIVEYVPLAIQYLKIQLQNSPNFDARLTYRKETEEIKKKSETEKGKCRIRKQTEIEKGKCRIRKQTEIEKERVEYVDKLKLKKKNVENVSKQESKKKNLENIKQQNILTFREIESVKKFVSTNYNVSCNEFHEIESFDQYKYGLQYL